MEYTTLGRTGLEVSVAGLGCGGGSQLGQRGGASEAESVDLVRAAMDLGVNFFDTAEAYGTEAIVGAAVKSGPRDRMVISSKSRIRRDGGLMAAGDIVANLEASLRRLDTDYVDVYHLHGVRPAHYDHVRNELVPALLIEKEKGKLRHLGITETGPNDHEHEMLGRALRDECWEVVMLAFHMMNQNARDAVFPLTMANGVGTLLMFVVRYIFSDPAYLAETMQRLAGENQLPAEYDAGGAPLDFLLHEGGAGSIVEAAYRYARHEPGAEVILFGTGSVGHLKQNIASILKPPLPEADRAKLERLFNGLRGVGLDMPFR